MTRAEALNRMADARRHLEAVIKARHELFTVRHIDLLRHARGQIANVSMDFAFDVHHQMELEQERRNSS